MMDTPERREKILSFVSVADTQEALRERWNNDKDSSSPQSKWADLKKTLADLMKRSKIRTSNPINDIIFNFTYPRLDAGVSNDLGHLLKAPFCVHPATGRVCVPIDPENCEHFDPFDVPKVSELVQEIDVYAKQTTTGNDPREKGLKDYKKTKLAPSISYFKKSFLKPLSESVRREKDETSNKMEF